MGLGALALVGAAKSGALNKVLSSKQLRGLSDDMDTALFDLAKGTRVIGDRIHDAQMGASRSINFWDEFQHYNKIDEATRLSIFDSLRSTEYITKNKSNYNEIAGRVIKNTKINSNSLRMDLKDDLAAYLEDAASKQTANKDLLKNATKEYQDLIIKKRMKDNGFIDRAITKGMGALGYSRVTVRDADAKNLNLFKVRSYQKSQEGLRSLGRINEKTFVSTQGEDFKDLYLHKAVFKDKKNNVVDLRKASSFVDKVLKNISQHTQIPIVNLNPLNILQYPLIKGQAIKDDFYVAAAGEKLHAGLIKAAGRTTSDVFVRIGNKVLDSEGKILKGKFTGISAGPATGRRLLSKQFGQQGAKQYKNNFTKFLDLGTQDENSLFTQIFSIGRKFTDKNWERNQIRNVISGNTISREYLQNTHARISSLIGDRTKSLNNEQIALIQSKTGINFKDIFGIDIDMDSKEGVINTLEKMVNINAESPYIGRLRSYWDEMVKTGKDFGKAERIMDNQALVLKDRRIISEFDDLKDTMSKEIMFNMNKANKSIVGKTTDQNILNWDILSKFDEKGAALRTSEEVIDGKMSNAANDYVTFVQNNQVQLRTTVDRYTSPFQINVIRDEEFGRGYSDTIAAGQTQIIVKSSNFSNIVDAINQSTKSKSLSEFKTSGGRILDEVKTFGMQTFFGGRNRIEDYTTSTMGLMFFLERNNRMLSQFGLGLSRESMGSPAEMLGALMFKRYLPAAGAATAFAYLNMESENIFGTSPKEIGAEVLAGEQLLVTSVRDITGETKRAKRRRQIRPGYEMFAEDAPWAMPFHALGLTGDDTTAELYDYQRNGQTPVRKGRWWPMGSSTPWRGEKIDRFEDSWYQKAHQEDAKAISLYGSEEEKFAYSWMPNPRNPLGFITPLVLDPYRLEREHYYDRPYMQTGPVQFLEDIPLVGPFAGVAGNAFKPPLDMHKQEIADLNKQTLQEGSPQIATYETAVSKTIQLGYNVVDGQIVGQQPQPGNKWITTEPIEGTAKEQMQEQLAAQNAYTKAVGGKGSNGATYMGGTSIADTYNPGVGAEFMSLSRAFTIPELQANYEDLMTQADPRYAWGEFTFRRTEWSGIFGFLEGNLFYGGNDKVFNRGPVIQRGMYGSVNDTFWDQDLGGLGGNFSEITRRFVPKPRRADYFNPIPNMMPEWMPGETYFTNFKTGDPFTKVKKGEGRLPGAGYEANHELHPDKFGDYGAFDRMKILADVAPWSQEYSYWSQYVTHNELDPEIRSEAAEIKRQVTAKKKKYEFFERKFQNSDIEEQKVHVTTVLDANTFLTEEYPDNPIRLAGVRVNKENEESVFRSINTGATLTIGYDPNDKIQQDTLKTIRATVWEDGVNLNKRYIDSGIGTEKETDDSAAGINARFTEKEIRKGQWWETFAHLNTPLHNKYLPVRTALEEYERDQVYGESWQSWDNPISGWLAPTLRNIAQSSIPMATITGTGIGALWGSTRVGQKTGALIGAGIGLISSTAVSLGELLSGDAWIPESTEHKREIDEYFDKIQYIKASRLFEQAKKKALLEEGVDVDEIIQTRLEKSANNKKLRDQLSEEKRQFLLRGAPDNVVAPLNVQLNEMKEDSLLKDIGPYTMLALKYNQDMGATLYGADEDSVWLDTYRALPVSDRPFFMEFMNAKTDKERKRILKLVPKNQKIMYQSKFGMEEDKKEKIEDYFQSHYLPNKNWAGWLPDVYLDDIKYKVVQNEGLDATEFGLWDDNKERAKILNIDAVTPDRPRKLFKSEDSIRNEISRIMRGYNMDNIVIDIQKIPNSIGMNIDVMVEDSAIEEFKRKITEDSTVLL